MSGMALVGIAGIAVGLQGQISNGYYHVLYKRLDGYPPTDY